MGTSPCDCCSAGVHAFSCWRTCSPCTALPSVMLWLHGVRIVLQVRLLHRNVGIRIGGASEVAVFGSIDHPAGNISVELLKNGFGRMVDWSLCTFHTSVLFV